jgi:hypothetical protein
LAAAPVAAESPPSSETCEAGETTASPSRIDLEADWISEAAYAEDDVVEWVSSEMDAESSG